MTNFKDLEKERTMVRKDIIPYGLYFAKGFISASLAEKGLGELKQVLELLQATLQSQGLVTDEGSAILEIVKSYGWLR